MACCARSLRGCEGRLLGRRLAALVRVFVRVWIPLVNLLNGAASGHAEAGGPDLHQLSPAAAAVAVIAENRKRTRWTDTAAARRKQQQVFLAHRAGHERIAVADADIAARR